MRAQHRLISIIFQHPTTFRIEKPRRNDIVVQYPIDKDFPLQCTVYIGPAEKARPVVLKNARYQVRLAIVLDGFDDGQARVVQVLFFDGNRASWPDGTLMVFDALRREGHAQSSRSSLTADQC